MLKIEGTNLPLHLHRSIVTFERTMIELQYMIENGDRLIEELNKKLNTLLEYYEELPNLAIQLNVKGKKYNKIQENFTWNVRILRGQIDLLATCKKESKVSISQV